MRLYMDLEIVSAREVLTAEFAMKGFLSCVCANMSFQVIAFRKVLWAYFTLKHFLSCVNTNVIMQIATP